MHTHLEVCLLCHRIDCIDFSPTPRLLDSGVSLSTVFTTLLDPGSSDDDKHGRKVLLNPVPRTTQFVSRFHLPCGNLLVTRLFYYVKTIYITF